MGEFTASRLIEIAEQEKGYLEKKSNSPGSSLPKALGTANAGSANWTKYGKWYGLNAQPWCAIFVSWCFGQLTGSKIEAQKMLCGFLWASCTQMYNAFKKAGRVYSSPRVGDIIVFNKARGSTTMAHTGIVKKVTGTRVYTIEGNTSAQVGVVENGGGVAEKNYPLSSNRIGGYLRPYYSEVSKTTTASAQTTTTTTITINPYILQKGSKGPAVKALQYCLKGWGYDCGTVDGDFGQKTDAALKKFQTNNKLEVDGIAGHQTWKTLTGAK